MTRTKRGEQLYASLTPTEREIAAALADNFTTPELVEEFGFTDATAKRHLSNIFDKCGVSTRFELFKLLVKEQVVPCLCSKRVQRSLDFG